MKKHESRVLLTEEQSRVLIAAASNAGMALSTYLRHCALNAAASAEARLISKEQKDFRHD